MAKLELDDLKYANAIARTLATRMLEDLALLSDTIADRTLQIEGDVRTKPLTTLLLGLMLESQDFGLCLERALSLYEQIMPSEQETVN